MQAWAFHARHPNSIGRNDMKNWLLGALVVALATSTPMLSEAKRLGSGKSQGMQRSAPAQPAPQTPPPKQAAPQQTAPTPAAAPAAAGATAAAAAAPAKRSWMGPIAGLAAGLGLAALMSHLGMGEAFANFLMLALLAVAAVFLIAFLMRRFGRGARQEPVLATAGASDAGAARTVTRWTPAAEPAPAQTPSPALEPATASTTQRSAFTPAAADVSVTGQPLRPLDASGTSAEPAATAAEEMAAAMPEAATGPKLPEGFDLPAFERVAKMIFIRLQAANDKGDLDDLRQFTTPEMFAAVRLDLQERGDADQQTDVEKVDAQVIDYAVEDGKQIVSVRFQGQVREETGAIAVPFDEVWHLVKPEGNAGAWAIAGIQQPQ
jgi:predicted lipid-binding transport protein (Tim44 family)